MAIDYLKQLAQSELPINVTEHDAVRQVEMLLVANLVTARLEKAGAYSLPYAATVYSITPAGNTLLHRLEERSKAILERNGRRDGSDVDG